MVIVDDETSILRALRSLFHRHPFRVEVFSECSEALGFITQQTPDIVISDMRMPEMTGAEFLTGVQALCPVSMRLLLSGYEDKKVIIDAIAQGIAQMYILKPWEDEEILGIIHSALAVRDDLRTKNLETYIHGITSLPSSVLMQAQIKRVFSESERSIKEVAAGVEKDPGLVAQLLRVANSVFVGARNPIANIQEAISFIGLEYVEGLILGTGMSRFYTGGADSAATKTIEDLWSHAMNRAFVGRAIAIRWPEYPRPQSAYITCLLLDIGFVVRLQMNPGEFLKLTQLADELCVPLHQAEQRLFDVDHTEIGAALLRFWNFPGEIVAAIAAHHGEHTADPLTRLVQMADVIEAGDFAQRHDTTLNATIEQLQKEIFTSNDSLKTQD
jgi:HD-like signal output (HDOD) protein